MRSWALAFLLGILLLQQLATLPPKYWVSIIIIFAVLTRKWRLLCLPVASLLGFAWALWYAYGVLSWNLPRELEGKPILVRGYIATIPNIAPKQSAFLFKLKSLAAQPTSALIKLTWQATDQSLRVGDEWQFIIRAKRIHGLMNPGGFDYEAFALQEKIRATGYIVKGENKLLSHNKKHFLLAQIRQQLKEKISKNLPMTPTSPWIVALALGERQNIAAEYWQVLRNTGTNHLMAIAGLHIGIVASGMFFLVMWCWRRVPFLMLKLPAQHAGAIGALCIALIYSGLAGFSLPTQRACIMLTVFLSALLLRRNMLSWQAWSIALLIVLGLNPLAVLTESFWLSFAAVALIIYGTSHRLAPRGWWWKLGRIQWVIALGLIPMSICLFQQFSWVSFIANSIAIPWVGFLVVPLTLLGCIFLNIWVPFGALMLQLADKLLSILWLILTYLAHLSWASWCQVMPATWVLLVAMGGILLLLSPIGFPGRYMGVLWLAILFFYRYPTPPQGHVWFTLLDVGQGLSAVVQTKNHFLVFDTGAKLNENYDMGESVVTPFLRSLGAKKIDLLVVSHADNDHSGGSQALLNNFSVTAMKTSVPAHFSFASISYCLQGEHWIWDNVQFEFLYPSRDKLNLGNNSSCVLRVTDAQHHTILLTGDIEKLAENALIASSLQNLAATILVAPHHGSKTSALTAFVNAVQPRYVLFAVGYRNRYHFPHSSVMEKYQALPAQLFATAEKGAIQFDEAFRPKLYRIKQQRYWR